MLKLCYNVIFFPSVHESRIADWVDRKKTTHPTPRLQLHSVHCPVETTFFQGRIHKVTEHVQITYSTFFSLLILSSSSHIYVAEVGFCAI